MNFEIDHLEKFNVIETNVSGKREVEFTLKAIQATLKRAEELDTYKFLFDYRHTFGEFGLGNFKKLISGFKENGLKKTHKVALISRYDSLDVEVIVNILNIKGWQNIHCFTDKTDALNWLVSADIQQAV